MEGHFFFKKRENRTPDLFDGAIAKTLDRAKSEPFSSLTNMLDQVGRISIILQRIHELYDPITGCTEMGNLQN